MTKRPELVVLNGPQQGRRISVPQTGIRLGRSSSNDIHFDTDEELSRNHCLVEAAGEDAIRVVDLASANGTYVNGSKIGNDAFTLKPGDIIEIGVTRLRVSSGDDADFPDKPAVSSLKPDAAKGDAPKAEAAKAEPGKAVDLGLGSEAAKAEKTEVEPKAPASPRQKILNLALAGALALVLVSIVLTAVMSFGGGSSEEGTTVSAAARKSAAKSEIVSVDYEKVAADSTHIFRYRLKVDPAGVISVVYHDLPGENAGIRKSAKLTAAARERIAEIFQTPGWNGLDGVYSGSNNAGDNELKSSRIRLVADGAVKDVLVENTIEPEAFRQVREALEAFSRNELGIWAMQYSREQLVKLSGEAEKLGDVKWNERDVEHANLSDAVKSYREALFYLETVSPKPREYDEIRNKLERTVKELDSRYRTQRFKVDRAINLADWENAREELRVLAAMITDKNDERYAEANARLVDVENRLTKKEGKKK